MDRFQKIELSIIILLLFANIGFFIYVLNFEGISGFVLLKNEKLTVPHDFITEENIIADKDQIIIKIENPVLSRYVNSESMLPILDEGTTGIGIKPGSEKDIYVGDIISFEQDGKMLVHRVIKIDNDENGIYFITKGDNNNLDDGKIRFADIDSVLVALVY